MLSFFVIFLVLIATLKFQASSFHCCCEIEYLSIGCNDTLILERVCNSSYSRIKKICCEKEWTSVCVEFLRRSFSICIPKCGNGICENPFTCSTCPEDCGVCESKKKEYCEKGSYDYEPLYSSEWYLENVIALHEKNITGSGVVIGIMSDGIQYEHFELQCRISQELSHDFTDSNYQDRESFSLSLLLDNHGTSIAGIIGASRNNRGILGVSYGSIISDLRVKNSLENQRVFENDYQVAKVLSFKPNEIDIILLSFLDLDLEEVDSPFSENTFINSNSAIHDLCVIHNRLFVTSGGFSFPNSNFLSLRNSPNIFTVSSGKIYGTNIAFSVPFGNKSIITTDKLGISGFTTGDFVSLKEESLFSAAIFSGYLVLLRSYKKSLSYRQFFWLFVMFSERVDSKDSLWTMNSFGLYYHPFYGFGEINISKCLDFLMKIGKDEYSLKNFEFWPVCELYESFSVTSDYDSKKNNFYFYFPLNHSIVLEHVQICFNDLMVLSENLIHNFSISITSPSSTKSVIWDNKFNERSMSKLNYMKIKKKRMCLTTLQFFGESSIRKSENSGDLDKLWTINLEFVVLRLKSIELIFHGSYLGCKYKKEEKKEEKKESEEGSLLISVSKIVIISIYFFIVVFLTGFFGYLVIRITFFEREKIEPRDGDLAEGIFLEMMNVESDDISNVSNYTDDSLDSTEVSDISMYE